MKRIIIAGITGFLGRHLATHLQQNGYAVEGLTRDPDNAKLPGIPIHRWNGRSLGPWATRINDAHALINLSGTTVNCRYTPQNRDRIIKSRTESTRVLGLAVKHCPRPPETWLNASTATIYRDARDRPMTEANGTIGQGFSVDVATAWENALYEHPLPKTRRIALRTSLILGHGSNSALPVLASLARKGLGGHIGDGQQIFSWIHIEDCLRAITFLLEEEQLEGPVNITAPAPLTNHDFMKQLRTTLHIPFGLPTPKPLLHVGAWLLRTEPELPLKSRWVLPEKLQQHRFLWKYPFLDQALNNLLQETNEPSSPKKCLSLNILPQNTPTN